MKCLILAGGSGTRLWPLARERHPKHIVAPIGKKTLLRQTFDRLKKITTPKDIFVVAGLAEQERVRKELVGCDHRHMIFEPARKGTTAAVALAASKIAERFPDEPLVIVAADHHVANEKMYAQAIHAACQAVTENPKHLVLFGAPPLYPETGYGYIKKGELLWRGEDGAFPAYAVETFKEKPDFSTAEAYGKSGQYVWNTGICVARASHFLSLIEKHVPRMAPIVKKGYEHMLHRFVRITADCFDRDVLEKEQRLLLIPLQCGWMDVGTWKAVAEVAAAQHMATSPLHIRKESDGTFIVAPEKKIVAVLGVKNLIVIDTPEALLITTPEKSMEVKQIVNTYKKQRTYATFF